MKQKKGMRSGRKEERLSARRVAVAVAVGLVCQIVFLWAYRTVLAEHYARRAQNASVSRKPQEAAAWAQRSLALNPHQDYAAFFAGLAEREQDRVAAASEFFRRALRTMAHRAQPLRELAACEAKAGDRAAAAQHLAEALAVEPNPSGGAALPRAQLSRHRMGLGCWADGLAEIHVAIGDAPATRFLAVAFAFALLASPEWVARGSEDLALSSRSPMLNSQIAAGLREIQTTLPPNDPRRGLLGDLLNRITGSR